MILRKETFALWRSFLRGLLPRRSETIKEHRSDNSSTRINAALSSIAIDINYHGKGFGRALMQEFELNARELGANSSSLTVEKENQAAINLYKSCGWMIDSENQNSYHFIKVY
jgi:ribosomal protein S18 acetylase RimI-like enzyme